MENVIQARYLPNKPNKPYFSYSKENEPSKSLFQQHGNKMGIPILPSKHLFLFRSCQRKNKNTTKGFNMILIQIFYILVCYIFRLLDKVKTLGNNATLILIKIKCRFKCRLKSCFHIHMV